MATITRTVVLDNGTIINHSVTLNPGDINKVNALLQAKYKNPDGTPSNDLTYLWGKQFEDSIVTIANAVQQMQQQIAAQQAIAAINLIPLTIVASA